jgi:hypothetical protein
MEPRDPKFCSFQIWSRSFKYGTCGAALGAYYDNPCDPKRCPLFDLSIQMCARFKELHGEDELKEIMG